MAEKPRKTGRYVYRASDERSKHKGKVGAYVVERFGEGKVIAKIETLGLVKEEIAEIQINLLAIQRGISFIGEWVPSINKKHQQIKTATDKKELF